MKKILTSIAAIALLLTGLLYADYITCDCGDVTFMAYADLTLECLAGCLEPRE